MTNETEVNIAVVTDSEALYYLLSSEKHPWPCKISRVDSGTSPEETRDVDMAVLDLQGSEEPLERIKKFYERFNNTQTLHILFNFPKDLVNNISLSKYHDMSILYAPATGQDLQKRISVLGEYVHQYKVIQQEAFELDKENAILSTYFSQDIRDYILNNYMTSDSGGIKTQATIMFFDIRESTRIAESLPPDTFAEFVSSLFEDVCKAIYDNHGSVNKYLGDGILATFGIPVFFNNDNFNAIKAAVDIRECIRKFNENLPGYLDKPIDFGIGIASGKVFAGNLGSSYRVEYTVVGDPVNLASRLESLTKYANVDVLVAGDTVNDLLDSLDVKKVRFNKIRGKINEVDIYYLRGIQDNLQFSAGLSEEELKATHANTAGEIDFF